uniref:Macrophage erythroblast attacher n=1 Tax=Phytophthora ramorum TaxID=164328 RepID=H3HCK3_PHYRM
MELACPLVRVPFEEASRSFRLYHKQMTRELAQATAQIEALDDGQQPGHRLDVDAAIDKLAELAQKLRELKQSAKSKVLEQQTDLESCASRARYLETLEEAKIGGDPSVPSRHEHHAEEHAMNDRLIADYLLRRGYLESAKIIEDTKAVLKDLRGHQTTSAIAWCSQNGSRLRRLQSTLEFHLRLQDFIEFVRSRKLLEAVQYARTYLTPLALQPEKQERRDAAIGEVQIAMATLAFESPEKCGIEAYEKVFAVDRWLGLEKMFRRAFSEVYGMHEPPSLCIALHAGLSTLNTRACHLTRDAISKPRLANSENRGKRQRREGREASDDAVDDSGNESDASLSARQLCAGLPFAYHPHSRLVCRVTQSVMDEHNPPLVLPNGRVYSKRGIELLTQRSSDGTIKCVDTHDVFSQTDVKPVYIL